MVTKATSASARRDARPVIGHVERAVARRGRTATVGPTQSRPLRWPAVVHSETRWARLHPDNLLACRAAVTGANLLHEQHLDALSGRDVAPSNLRLVCRSSLSMGGASILSVLAGD